MDTTQQKLNMSPIEFFEQIAASMPLEPAGQLRQWGAILTTTHLYENMEAVWEGMDIAKWHSLIDNAGGKIEWVTGIARRLGKSMAAATPETGPTADRHRSPPSAFFRQPRWTSPGVQHITLGRKLLAQNDLRGLTIPRGIVRGIGTDGFLIEAEVKELSKRIFLWILVKYETVHGDVLLYRYLGNGLAVFFPTLPDRGTTPGAMRRWWKIIKVRFENGRRVAASLMYKNVSMKVVDLTAGVKRLIEGGLHINLVDGEGDEAEAAAGVEAEAAADDDAGSDNGSIAPSLASSDSTDSDVCTLSRPRSLSPTLTLRAATPPSLVSPL